MSFQCTNHQKEMGSSPLLSFLVLTSLVVLFVTPSHSSEYDVVQEPAPPVTSRKISRNSEKVTMSLYYESLCPYCSSFIVGPLAQVLETDLMTILNLRLVPWGNAILDSNSTIECQVAISIFSIVLSFCFLFFPLFDQSPFTLVFCSMGKMNAI